MANATLEHIFGMNSNCLLLYLKIMKSHEVKDHDPSVHPSKIGALRLVVLRLSRWIPKRECKIRVNSD